MLTVRSLLLISAVWLLTHLLIWVLVYNFEPSRHPWVVDTMLKHWDSVHFNSIILNGYSGDLWAFYPLYPVLSKGFSLITGLGTKPELAGTILSTFIFAAFCLIQARLINNTEPLTGLKPETIWGWLIFLFSPVSYVFHSHHTESLFLLLTFGALLSSRQEKWLPAALLAGLCAVTRNQGVILAFAVAIDGALQQPKLARRVLVFGLSGLISSLIFICYPVYQYFKIGDPLAFVHVQNSWGVVNSVYGFFGTLWFANSWQGREWTHLLHHVFFFLINISAVGLFLKKQYAIVIYVLLSTWMQLYSGDLDNAFRYGAVLFPALFFLGDEAAKLPAFIKWSIFICFLIVNIIYTRNFALGVWAY